MFVRSLDYTARETIYDATLEELREMHDLLLLPVEGGKLEYLERYLTEEGFYVRPFEDESGHRFSAARWMIEYLAGRLK